MLQNVLPGENSGQKSCFFDSNFHEKISSEMLLVPKSRFYRFSMTLGNPNDLLLVTLGLLWFAQGHLRDRLGAQIDPKLEILTKSAPKMIPYHQNNLPKW